jgi:hypothetical protein
MDSCSRCNWSGPAGLASCPRCGQPLSSAAVAPTMVQTTARPVLVLKLLGGELPPEEWEIEGVPVGIGRLDDSDVTLPHRSVSRHHARIVPSANGYELEDLGSTNGTWLNDKPIIDRVALSDGDSVMVGDVPLVVELIRPQRQAPPEIYDVPQLLAGPTAPARTPQAAEGGASTVFYELDAALAAAGPAEPAQAQPPLQPAQPPADYQRAQPAQRPADYRQTTPDILQPTVAQPPAGYRRTPSPGAQPPAVETPASEVEVPRAWDDTPSTRLDLGDQAGLDPDADDEHPTLIAGVPVQQFQSAAEVAPKQPPSASPQPAQREPWPASPPPGQREPWPASPQPGQREPWSSGAQTSPREPSSTGPQPGWYAPPRTAQPAPSQPPASGLPELTAASMIDLAEHLAAALRLLKGDIALAMWLFEHAGGPPAAQEFVDHVHRLQADPNNSQDLADVVESAPTAARLLEAAVLLVNVLSSSLDPASGVDNQLEADAADLQPVARS